MFASFLEISSIVLQKYCYSGAQKKTPCEKKDSCAKK